MSWVSDWINEKRREEAEFGGTDGWHMRYFAMKAAIEEAARRVREGGGCEGCEGCRKDLCGRPEGCILAMLEDKS